MSACKRQTFRHIGFRFSVIDRPLTDSDGIRQLEAIRVIAPDVGGVVFVGEEGDFVYPVEDGRYSLPPSPAHHKLQSF